MSYLEQRRWHGLQLLSRTGLGIESLAPALCRALREIVGVEAAGVFWVDDDGMPVGYFHEDAPNSAREPFANDYDRLFTGSGEINVSQLARMKGRKIGWMAWPDPSYFRSNTFNLLIRGSGHHHTLDMRVESEGRTRAVVMLFRTEQAPYTDEDAAVLARTAPYVERIVAAEGGRLGWEPAGLAGHILMRADGTAVELIDEAAASLLRNSGLVRQGTKLDGPSVTPPAFLSALCRELAGHAVLSRTLSVPEGRLAIQARVMHRPGGSDGPPPVMVSLQSETSRDLRIVERLLAIDISPMQREIMMLAGQGVSRLDSIPKLGISNEAMKKHLSAIYAATGVNKWEDLAGAA